MKRSSSRRPPEINRLFNTIRKHGLDTVPRIQLLMKWVDLDPADRTIINELRETATEEYKLQRLNPDPFRKTTPRENHHLNGVIQLGTIPHFDFPYGIEMEILKKHLLVAGMNGGGKTTSIRNLLIQILQLSTLYLTVFHQN